MTRAGLPGEIGEGCQLDLDLGDECPHFGGDRLFGEEVRIDVHQVSGSSR